MAARKVGRSFLSFAAIALAMAAFLPGRATGCGMEHPAKPLLWKVEGKGLAKPSYLFGTIHVSAPVVLKLHPAAQKAFDGADVVYTEVAMDAETRLAATPFFLRKDGKTLSEFIGDKLFARFEEELEVVHPDLDAKPFEAMSTWAAAITLPSLPDLIIGKPVLDEVLWKEATKAGKRTGALETVASNAEMFEKMGDKAQLAMLSGTMEYLKKCREEKKDFMTIITKVYVAGDIEGIKKEMGLFFDELERGENAVHGKLVRKGLLDERDVKMAATALAALEKEPNLSHFFAAGAAHFMSGTSIAGQLSKAGYTVTRIEQ